MKNPENNTVTIKDKYTTFPYYPLLWYKEIEGIEEMKR